MNRAISEAYNWLNKVIDAKPVPSFKGVDITNPEVLNTYDDKPTTSKRKGVNKMPIAKERSVRYTGNFSFIVRSDDPESAAKVLAAIRAHGTVTNVRSINVRAAQADESVAS